MKFHATPNIKIMTDPLSQPFVGGDGGSRTHTVSPPLDFESSTSASSITSPNASAILAYLLQVSKTFKEIWLLIEFRVIIVLINCKKHNINGFICNVIKLKSEHHKERK